MIIIVTHLFVLPMARIGLSYGQRLTCDVGVTGQRMHCVSEHRPLRWLLITASVPRPSLIEATLL